VTTRDDERSVPWWRLATSTLLLTAFALSLAAGRTVEAIIAAVLLIPSLLLLGVWVYLRLAGRL
jgi:hypothetical protein